MLKKLFGRKKDAPPHPSQSAAPPNAQQDPRSPPGNVPYRPVLASDPSQWLQSQQQEAAQHQVRSASSEDLHSESAGARTGAGYRQNGASGGQHHAGLKSEQAPRADERWRTEQKHGHSTPEMAVNRQAPRPKAAYQEPTSTVVCNIGELDAHSNMVSQLKLRANERHGEKNWRRERTRRESWPPRLSDASEELRDRKSVV